MGGGKKGLSVPKRGGVGWEREKVGGERKGGINSRLYFPSTYSST